MGYKASVVIPNLNGAGWLRDSIESVWAQTEQAFELIVIDNGSKDESLDIARSYCGRENYTLIENGSNTGFSYAVNQGIAAAKARGVHMGRPRKERGDAYERYVEMWERGQISAREAAAELGIAHTTFLTWVRE